MSRAHPSPAAVESARGLLRAMSAALQTYRLYPERHPNRQEAAHDMVERARSMVSAQPDAVLFVARHSLYLGPLLLAHESLALSRLLDAFERAGVEAVEVFSGVTVEDIDTLVGMLQGERPLDADLSGMAINRVRPAVSQEDDREREMAELFKTYASGLELLRDTASQVASGEQVDLESTRGMVEQLTDQIARDPVQALLVTTVKSYDEYTYYHMVNVAMLSIALGFAVGLQRDQVVLLGLGGLLHDVGKVKVSRDVLQEPGQLNEEQWRLIQRHPVDGAGLVYVTTRDLLHPAASMVLEHHAAFDMGGYPKLSSRQHPSMPARLIAVTDCFDAVTSKRSYRRAEDRRQALNIIQAAAGRGYDPRLVRSFVRLLGVYPVGSLVRLSTGEVGLVVRNNDEEPARPVVRLVLDPEGTACEPENVDTAERGPDEAFRREITETLDAEDLGVDMTALLRSGAIQEAGEPGDAAEQGLVHEPGHGERPPEGYVDTHREPHEHAGLPVEVDDELAPPFPEAGTG